MKTTELVARELKKKCPEYYSFLEGICAMLKKEDLDFLPIFSGMEGSGKSNAILVTVYTMAYLLGIEVSMMKNWFFSGHSYLTNLRYVSEEMFAASKLEPNEFGIYDVRDSLDKIDIKDLDEVKEKWKFHFWVLDEAQDLMHTEFMNKFNKGFVKIMMAIREHCMIFPIAYPDITMLNRYIRHFRIKVFNYCFVMPDGARAMATYTRRKYIRILRDKSKNIQMNLLLGDEFINRYKPDFITERMPRFPTNTQDYIDYLKLKRMSMSGLVLASAPPMEV